jgi:hypothetical protein
MSPDEWREAFQTAWKCYYTPEHTKTLLRRARACGIKTRKLSNMLLWFHGASSIEGLHPLDSGYFRIKSRHGRRPNLPVESAPVFYARYGWEILSKHLRFLNLLARLRWFSWKLERDSDAVNYRDVSSGA